MSLNCPNYNEFIYLDHAATTPIAPEVRLAMNEHLDWQNNQFANPASDHYLGRQAKQLWNESLCEIAGYLGCEANEILVTSCATESINLALKGALLPYKQKKAHLITTTLEHQASLQVAQSLMREGVKVSFIQPNEQGQILPSEIAAAIDAYPNAGLTLVSINWMNNETGSLANIYEIRRVTKEKEVLLHLDATQAIPRIKMNECPADLLSMSGHKCYAPKGVGLLVRRAFPKITLQAQLDGGGAQMGIRAGTYPVSQLIALREALRRLEKNREKDAEQSLLFHQKIMQALKPFGVQRNGGLNCHPSIMNVHIPNVLAETLMALTPNLGFSTGSACTTQSNAPSHVLQQLGLSNLQARQSIRLSPGCLMSVEQLDNALSVLSETIAHLQALSQGCSSSLPLAIQAHKFSNLSTSIYQRLCCPKLNQVNMPDSEEIASWLHQDESSYINIRVWKQETTTGTNSLFMTNIQIMADPYALVLASILNEKIATLDLNELRSDGHLSAKPLLTHWLQEANIEIPMQKIAVLVCFEKGLDKILQALESND